METKLYIIGLKCGKIRKTTVAYLTEKEHRFIPFRLFSRATLLDSCRAVVCKYHEPV